MLVFKKEWANQKKKKKKNLPWKNRKLEKGNKKTDLLLKVGQHSIEEEADLHATIHFAKLHAQVKGD